MRGFEKFGLHNETSHYVLADKSQAATTYKRYCQKSHWKYQILSTKISSTHQPYTKLQQNIPEFGATLQQNFH